MTSSAIKVFVNCPFDNDFKPAFVALIFTITAAYYRVRCALEENDGGDIRFDKLCRLIRESDKSIHDLSRVEPGHAGLPRFNMPFELGLFMGARRVGGKRQNSKTALVMVKEPYRLPIYMSDFGGNDPLAHRDRPEEVIRIVRRYLSTQPDGTPLPGAARIQSEFDRFKGALPVLAAELRIAPGEIDPFRDYPDYLALLTTFLQQA